MITYILIAFALVQFSYEQVSSCPNTELINFLINCIEINKNYFIFQTVDELIECYLKLVDRTKPNCFKESGVDTHVIDREIRHGQFSDDRAAKCYWKCFFKKLNLIADNDEIIKENIKQYVGVADKKGAEEVFEKCAHIKKSDPCDTTSEITKCIYTTATAILKKSHSK